MCPRIHRFAIPSSLAVEMKSLSWPEPRSIDRLLPVPSVGVPHRAGVDGPPFFTLLRCPPFFSDAATAGAFFIVVRSSREALLKFRGISSFRPAFEHVLSFLYPV